MVEIDLLRGGRPLPVAGNSPSGHYRFIISRQWQRPQAHLYVFSLQDTIPVCPVPLRTEAEDEPSLNLQALLQDLYRQAGYDLRIDYRAEPVPPPAPPDAVWADELLRRAGVRV